MSTLYSSGLGPGKNGVEFHGQAFTELVVGGVFELAVGDAPQAGLVDLGD
jgi:hypothetical protein